VRVRVPPSVYFIGSSKSTGLRNKNGKRARLFFKTKSDATAELDRIKIKFRDAGEKALEITDELRLAALKCARRLEAYGKTIVDATDHTSAILRTRSVAARLPNSGTSFLEVSAKQSAQYGTSKICATAWVVSVKPSGIARWGVACR